MAWNDVASNQMVSYFDASTSGIPLLSGQSHFTTLPAANQCMTKANMQAKYNLNATNLSTYTSLQLVPKSAWAAGFSGPIFIFNGTPSLYTGNSALIPYPTTVLSGDFIILSIRSETVYNIDVPAGFTLIPPDANNSTLDMANYYKFASGSEGGTSVTVTSRSASRIAGMTLQYRNVNTSIPFSPSSGGVHVISGGVTTSFTNTNNPSSANNQLGVALFSITAPSISSVSSATWTHRGGATFSAGVSHAFVSATQEMPTSGTSAGTITVTVPAQTTGTMWTLFLNPV
jgi:hypothetical protein